MLKHAFVTPGILRLANFATVSDHVQVKAILDFVGNNFVKQFIGSCLAYLLVQPTEPFADSVNVGVNGKDGFAETEKQNAGSGFRSNPGQPFEPIHRFRNGHFREKIERKFPLVGFSDPLQHRFNSRRFLV